MGHWNRKDQGSSGPDRAGYPTKTGPVPRPRAVSPVKHRDGRSYPERCDPFGDLIPLTENQRGLAAQYLPLAQGLARGYRFGRFGEREELESTAYMALVEAAQKFDPKRNVNFATYARHRIRGALRDYQRIALSENWRGEEAYRPVFTRLVRGAEQHGRVLGVAPQLPVGALLESKEAVEEWLSRLPYLHAAACRLIYLHGQSQDEVAAQVGCSKSFLSRLHREAISWLIMDHHAAQAGQQRDPSETSA